MRWQIIERAFNVNITLFRSVVVVCGIDNITWNIVYIQSECEKYSSKYCQFHQTLLWI